MKRRIGIVALVVTLIFSVAVFGACGKPPAPAPVNEPEEPIATPIASADLSDDPYSFTFRLDGVVYALPVAFSELQANGWELKNDMSGETLDPDQYSSVNVLLNGKHQIYADFVNTTPNVLPFEECNVGGVSLDVFDAEQGAELIFPAGITIGTPGDDVIKAYGEPSDRYESEYSTSLTYTLDSYASLKILLDIDTNLVSDLDMQNLIPKEQPAPAAGGDGSEPAILASYNAPGDLGKSWDTFNVIYDGAKYHIPAPATEFTKNGWVFVTDENEMVSAKDSAVGVEIRKGNQVLRTIFYNYDTSAQPLKYCYVTEIEYYDLGAKVSIELPGGLTEKSKIEDFIKVYGQPAKTDESATFNYYDWGKIWESLELSVDQNGVITHITLEHSPKNAND
jgi:hypothetical protein